MTEVLAFLIGLLCAIAYLISLFSLGRYLKKKHYATWLQLGSPTNPFGSSMISMRNLYIFVIKNEFSVLGDEVLDRLCRKVKFLMYVGVGAFLYLQISFILRI